ncbi:uncharacterized protein LOC116202562 isoform X2 [Punica granatum]|uniref:Uncharacterized protein LOC116202562 isoform X2 n=1 Tax=Punica granatum TaxID=22663 RepID=A0A6P8D8Y2_PUNGR|nr:uncharacterized protein LOC116202562 isoform X2 [Punica granatum]
MADVKRWSVTYTKHLKQKRKVYHDGFLVLHSSAHKVMLYDESETLLECRILKDEEFVRSGESLTFNAYLIDVGDPEGDLEASKDSKNSSMSRNEAMSPPVSAGWVSKTEKNKAQNISLSPSRKIIREFKKRELHKYGTLQKSTNSVEPRGTEWQVLYTTQLTQKAKKYHDGFLRCPNTGSMGRQVMLYDESWKLLESRFLKKGEEVRSGETMEFHGLLVEVGECKGNNKTVLDMNAKGSSCSSFQKLEAPNQRIDINVGRAVVKEWQVLYTTQVTQKAKKYHDGYLQLVTCGSLGRQVMLYDASRKLLGSRFLKKDEIIGSGFSVTFDAHLVDIGEPEGQGAAPTNSKDQGICSGGTGDIRIGHGNLDCTKVNESMKRVHSSEMTCSGRSACTDSGSYFSEKQKSSQGISKDKPLRDALGILSILQKPAYKGNVAADYGNKSLLVTLDSPTKKIEESDACTFNSCNDNELLSALATEAGSIEQSNENPRIKRPTSLGGTTGESESKEKNFARGSAIDEGKISGVESASKVDEEWPSFDLGF